MNVLTTFFSQSVAVTREALVTVDEINRKNDNEDFQFRYQGMVHRAAKMSQ